MVEGMDQTQVIQQEYNNHGTSWTRNEFFDRNGYIVIKNLCDPKELFHPVPELRGQLSYRSKNLDDFEHIEVEGQVEGSIARYWHPHYRQVHSDIRKIIEMAIERKLYNTYYYDRFYFSGQQLTKHTDREACEISVSIHINTNLEENWPIYFKTTDKYTDSSKKKISQKGKIVGLNLERGDGVVYKGCERPHWRDAMPGTFEEMNGHEKFYYHQIFFHYVLQDGMRAHFAFDRGTQ